jgi:phenylpropionate dioxygenase-like ring-hydroxylating dioxygenase large terminal subunit
MVVQPAPNSRGHFSVASLPGQWFIACRSRDLRGGPLGVTLQGVPLVLFRGARGVPGALEDRCPHRNVPLTAGRVRGGSLECAYHGWRYDAGGSCLAVPGLVEAPKARATRATAYPCLELDGYVWVYSTPGVEPSSSPFRFPLLDDPSYTTVHRQYQVRSTLLAALENTLDVPHTAFLHGGWFRTGRKETEIDVVVRRYRDRCEAEFIGEPRPGGLVGMVLAPRGGVVTHFDRFLLPSIAQVEYRLGSASHLMVTTAMTPTDEFVTRLFVAVTFLLPVPGWLAAAVLSPIAARIFKQDADILALQADNVLRFGGESFATTEIDVLGPQIWRLLRQAGRGDAQGEQGADDGRRPQHEHRVRMRV